MVLQTCNMRVADASPTPRRWTPERISICLIRPLALYLMNTMITPDYILRYPMILLRTRRSIPFALKPTHMVYNSTAIT